MCFNAPASLASFIVGTVLAIVAGTVALQLQYHSLAVLSFAWFWVICMQWWEFMVWRNWHADTASRMAYIFNAMQIPLLFLLFVFDGGTQPWQKYTASVVVATYLFIMMSPPPSDMVEAREGHLYYTWWDSPLRTVTYFVALSTIFLLLIRPLAWSVACLVTLLLLFALSGLLYRSQSIASLWCFFAAFFPVLALGLRCLLSS